MKKIIFIVSFLFAILAFFPASNIKAQTGNPWEGPRWSSIKANDAVWQWIEDNGHYPDLSVDGEWVDTDWSYQGKSVWKVVITWGVGGSLNPEILGTRTLYIKNSGAIIAEE